MIAWFKKKEEEEPTLRRVFVPEAQIVDILEAWDQYESTPENGNALLRWRFWRMAEHACPELMEGHWVAKMKHHRVPYFQEIQGI